MKDTAKPTSREQGQNALRQAQKAASRGDRAEAERWVKIADKLAAVAEKIAALPEPIPDWQEVERLKAELRERVRRAIAAGEPEREWEERSMIREAVAAFAREHGLPEPPPLGPKPDCSELIMLAGRGRDVSSDSRR